MRENDVSFILDIYIFQKETKQGVMESLQKDKENQQKHEEEEMRKELERMPPPPTITLDEIMYDYWI